MSRPPTGGTPSIAMPDDGFLIVSFNLTRYYQSFPHIRVGKKKRTILI